MKPAAILLIISIPLICYLQTSNPVTGVYITDMGLCNIEHFTPESDQPFRIFAIACRGVDMIKVWPLPLEFPWFEDWYEYEEEHPFPQPLYTA